MNTKSGRYFGALGALTMAVSLLAVSLLASFPHGARAAQLSGAGVIGKPFQIVAYFCAGGTGSGGSASDCADQTATTTFASLPAKTVITAVHVTVTTAVTGSSPQINVGDVADADGYVDDGDVTEGTAATYASNAAYTLPKYQASASAPKMTPGGTLSAGAFTVVMQGYRL